MKWDGRADKDHWTNKHWPSGTQFLPVSKKHQVHVCEGGGTRQDTVPASSCKTWPYWSNLQRPWISKDIVLYVSAPSFQILGLAAKSWNQAFSMVRPSENFWRTVILIRKVMNSAKTDAWIGFNAFFGNKKAPNYEKTVKNLIILSAFKKTWLQNKSQRYIFSSFTSNTFRTTLVTLNKKCS